MTTAREAYKAYVTLSGSNYYVLYPGGRVTEHGDRTGAQMAAGEHRIKTGEVAEVLTKKQWERRMKEREQ